MASGSVSYKWPPKFDETGYETWKNDVEIWCDLTDLVPSKRAMAIHLSLDGRARIASSELSKEELKKENGVKTLLDKLDGLFLPEKGRRQFTAFQNLHNLRRKSNVPVHEFIAEFEHGYFKFQKEDMRLPDAVMAFMLLSSCNLAESDVHLVMSALSDITFKNMKSVLKRVFASSMKQNGESSKFENIDIKVEPVFQASDESQESFFARNKRGFRGGRFSNRGSRGAQRGRGNNRNFNKDEKRKLNPVGTDGEVSRCLICESKFHWARECPHAYENSKDDEEPSENVQLSLFMGFTNQTDDKKLSNLLLESRESAVMDTGCSTTVCGKSWLGSYVACLDEKEISAIQEFESTSTFTFGDGQCYPSEKRVILPCWIGKIKANISVDVVTCDIPLLLSAKSMKNANMIWDFKNDSVKIGSNLVNLIRSSSGHYLLPLRF